MTQQSHFWVVSQSEIGALERSAAHDRSTGHTIRDVETLHVHPQLSKWHVLQTHNEARSSLRKEGHSVLTGHGCIGDSVTLRERGQSQKGKPCLIQLMEGIENNPMCRITERSGGSRGLWGGGDMDLLIKGQKILVQKD